LAAAFPGGGFAVTCTVRIDRGDDRIDEQV
jgi:hypothetical protein